MRHPGAIEPVGGLAPLVRAQRRKGRLVGLLVGAAGDLCRHAAHRVGAAPVAGLHEQLGIGAHERHGHRDLLAVRRDELRPRAEALDRREDVVPAPCVQARRVLAQLVEDLVHLEGGRERLDEDGRLDRAALQPEVVLGAVEDVVPQARLAVGLQLRQVEVRPGAAVEQLTGVVEDVEAEVHEPAGHRLAVDEQVALHEVPAARTHEKRRDLVAEGVLLALLLVLDRAADRVAEVHLPADHVVPGGRVGVLEVRHEPRRARVQGVDHHLPARRTGDLDAAVLQRIGLRRDVPVALAHVLRGGQEVQGAARVELLLALHPGGQQLAAGGVERAVQPRHELQRVRRQDLVEALAARPVDLDCRAHGSIQFRTGVDCR
jgi:hypothetical protein